MTNKDNNRQYRENRGPRKAPQDSNYDEYNEYNDNNEYNDYNDNNYDDNYDDSYDDGYDDGYDNDDSYDDSYDNDDSYDDSYDDGYDNDNGYDDYDDNYDDGYDAGYAPRRARSYDDGYDDYDDGYDDYGPAYRAKPANTKPIIIGVIAAILLVLAIIFVPKIIYALKPDAVISTKDMDIIIDVKGFDGHAVASGSLTGMPEITDTKLKDKNYEILDSITYGDIEFDKKEGLKNGDKIVAKVKLISEKFKLKFDSDTIEKEMTVEGLAELVNSFAELPDDFTDRLDKRANKSIYDSLYKPDGLKIERLALMEKPMDEAEIYEVSNSYEAKSRYRLLGVYKASFNESDWWSGTKTRKTQYYIMDSYNFQKANGKVISEFYFDGYYSNYDELVNNLGFKGYQLLDEKKAKEDPKEEKTDDKDDDDDKEEKDDEDDQNEAKEETNDIGKTFYVKNEGNLREDYSLDADVIVKLSDGAEVTVNDEKHTDDGRTWYLVDAVDIDGASYSGWISSRVLR